MTFHRLKLILTIVINSALEISIFFSVVFFNTDSANADTYIMLPGRHVSQKLLDGSQIDLTLSREHAKLKPSVVAAWTSHLVLVSGVYTVRTPQYAKATLQAGYLLGCSLEFMNGVYQFPSQDALYATGGEWELKSPQTGFLPQLTWPEGDEPGFGIDFGLEQFTWTGTAGNTRFSSVISSGQQQIVNGFGGIVYDDFKQVEDGCAGSATARAKAILTVQTDKQKAILTLWGKPFSLNS